MLWELSISTRILTCNRDINTVNFRTLDDVCPLIACINNSKCNGPRSISVISSINIRLSGVRSTSYVINNKNFRVTHL